MKVSVGIPVYDRKLDMQIVSSLTTELLLASKMENFELNPLFLPACSDLARGRNQIVREFLESDSDKLMFLDADVSFEPGAMIKVAHYPYDVVGGCYRLKQQEEDYPLGFLDKDELWANEHGLLEVAMLPTGFLCISRDAFYKFRGAYPHRTYESRGKESFAYFEIPYMKGSLYTEDSYFCEKWLEIGGKIYLDPELKLTHWDGNIPYHGHIGNWLRNRIEGEHQDG